MDAAPIALLAASLFVSPALAVDSSEALYAAIESANGNGTTTITLTGPIELTEPLPPIGQAYDNIVIDLNGYAVSGEGAHRIFFVNAGNVTIRNGTLAEGFARGGNGGAGDGYDSGAGGGGMGAGGALFVRGDLGASVVVENVSFLDNHARGGDGGSGSLPGDRTTGGGGGMGGNGGAGFNGGFSGSGGAGGGAFAGQNGQDGQSTGVSYGGGPGGGGASSPGGEYSGGGGGGFMGGSGGYGGGGGGGGDTGTGGAGGFGGGGGGGGHYVTLLPGGNAGFGGGGGGGGIAGAGGFGGGDGAQRPLASSGDAGGAAGGGGAGFGGAVFVQQGASITFSGDMGIAGGTATGGNPGSQSGTAGSGRGAGTGLFLQGNGTLTLEQASGEAQTIADEIVDQTGLGGTGANAGAWSLVKNGAGTLVLSGANTYSGGTALDAGTLALGNSAAAGGGAVVAEGGALTLFNDVTIANAVDLLADLTVSVHAGTSGLSGLIDGDSRLTKTSSGALILSGANTYAGGTTVNGGVLRIAGAGTLGATSSETQIAGGELDLGGTTQTQDGGLVVTGGAMTNGTFTSADTFDLQRGTVSAALAGAGAATKSGSGTVHLSGTNTFTGATTVDAGLLHIASGGSIASSASTVTGGGLVVNGTAGSVNIVGGFLGGAGTVGVTTIGAGGALSPGNSIGTLTVDGGLSFADGSVYVVEISPKAADRTNVRAVGGNGAADLSGATVVAVYGAGKYVAKKYVIVDAEGGLGGTTFKTLKGAAPRGMIHRLGYDANSAWLELSLGMTKWRGLSRNQRQVEQVLSAFFDRTGWLAADFAGLSQAGLTIASAEVGASAQRSGLFGSGRFLEALSHPFPAEDAGSAGIAAFAPERPSPASERFARMSYAAEELGGGTDGATRAMRLQHALEAGFATQPNARPERYSVWGAALGGGFSLQGDPAVGSQAMSGSVYGLASGFDWTARDSAGTTRAGFALGGSIANTAVAGLGTSSTGTASAGIRVSHDFGRLYLASAFAYGLNFVTTSRAVGAETYSAGFTGHTVSGRLEGGWRFRTAAADLIPFAAVRAVSFSAPAYTETGSGAGTFALSYAPQSAIDARSELGLRLGKTIAHATGASTTLSAMAGWAHHFARANSAVAGFATLPDTSFTTRTATGAANTALVSLGVSHRFARGIGISLEGSGEFGAGTVQYNASTRLKFAW